MSMNIKFIHILAGLFIVVCYVNAVCEAQIAKKGGLDARQEAIVPIAAFTASGDLQKLKQAMNKGLNTGLTINEIKEILVQLYAYAGFPRSLNAIGTFMGVVEERQKRGIQDEMGKDASAFSTNKGSIEMGTEIQTRLVGRPVTGAIFTFTPAIDQFLKGHLFGDIFGRDNLDFQSREIATIAALSNMDGVNSQLRSHFDVGFNVGLTEEQMKSLIFVIETKVGKKQADNAFDVLGEVHGGMRKVSDKGPAEQEQQNIIIERGGSQPSRKGPSEWFTGSVSIDTPFQAHDPAHFKGASVSFEPGARTAWHAHPMGQLLIVTSGIGRVQRWGDQADEIREGDVVWIPPYQKHWHGAAPDSPMIHIAIIEKRTATSTQWMEKVNDEEYETMPE